MKKNIIDAESRFEGKNKGVDGSKQAQDNLQRLLKRLKHAGKVIDQLNATPRIPKPDRPILARNLGYIFERALRRGIEVNLAQVFNETFGEEIGESHYKKRKRYIRLKEDESSAKNENSDVDTYVARGTDYLKLAINLAPYTSAASGYSDEEVYKLTILRLIEGSSFDDRMGIAERHELEQRSELIRRLDQMIDRLISRVDLDWMRDWSQRNHIGLLGDTGEMKSVSYIDGGGWGGGLDINGDIEGDCYNRIAPCVRLGSVYSRYIPDGMLKVAASVDSIEQKGETDAIRYAFVEAMHGQPDDNWEELPTLSDFKEWIDLEGYLDNHRSIAWYRRYIDIEVRFSPEAEKWKACLLLRPPRDSFAVDLEIEKCFFAKFYNGEASHSCLWLGREESSDDAIYAALINDGDGENTYAIFTDSNFSFDPTYYQCNEHVDMVLGSAEGAFVLPGERGFNFAFGDMYKSGHLVVFDIETCEGKYTPAPHDSVAGAILRNLAYAPVNKRLDYLLIEDAKHRVELVEELAKSSQASYEDAIKRLDGK